MQRCSYRVARTWHGIKDSDTGLTETTSNSSDSPNVSDFLSAVDNRLGSASPLSDVAGILPDYIICIRLVSRACLLRVTLQSLFLYRRGYRALLSAGAARTCGRGRLHSQCRLDDRERCQLSFDQLSPAARGSEMTWIKPTAGFTVIFQVAFGAQCKRDHEPLSRYRIRVVLGPANLERLSGAFELVSADAASFANRFFAQYLRSLFPQ